MPAGGEDVSEEGEVGFVLGAGGELEAVEVGVGDAEVLGLWMWGGDVRLARLSSREEGERGGGDVPVRLDMVPLLRSRMRHLRSRG